MKETTGKTKATGRLSASTPTNLMNRRRNTGGKHVWERAQKGQELSSLCVHRTDYLSVYKGAWPIYPYSSSWESEGNRI